MKDSEKLLFRLTVYDSVTNEKTKDSVWVYFSKLTYLLAVSDYYYTIGIGESVSLTHVAEEFL